MLNKGIVANDSFFVRIGEADLFHEQMILESILWHWSLVPDAVLFVITRSSKAESEFGFRILHLENEDTSATGSN